MCPDITLRGKRDFPDRIEVELLILRQTLFRDADGMHLLFVRDIVEAEFQNAPVFFVADDNRSAARRIRNIHDAGTVMRTELRPCKVHSDITVLELLRTPDIGSQPCEKDMEFLHLLLHSPAPGKIILRCNPVIFFKTLHHRVQIERSKLSAALKANHIHNGSLFGNMPALLLRHCKLLRLI